MRLDASKIDMILARQCKSLTEMRVSTSPKTLRRIREGEDVRPKTAGKIARFLGVDIAEIIREVAM